MAKDKKNTADTETEPMFDELAGVKSADQKELLRLIRRANRAHIEHARLKNEAKKDSDRADEELTSLCDKLELTRFVLNGFVVDISSKGRQVRVTKKKEDVPDEKPADEGAAE